MSRGDDERMSGRRTRRIVISVSFYGLKCAQGLRRLGASCGLGRSASLLYRQHSLFLPVMADRIGRGHFALLPNGAGEEGGLSFKRSGWNTITRYLRSIKEQSARGAAMK